MSNVPLFQLDVNIENLKKYLSQFTNQLQEQESKVQDLEYIINEKLEKNELNQVLQKLEKSTDLFDNQLKSLILKQVNQSNYKNYTSEIEKNGNNLAYQLNLLSNANSYFFQKIQQLEKQNKSLEDRMDQKSEKDDLKEQIKNIKKRLEDKMEANFNVLDNERKELDTKLSNQISEFDQLVKDVERRTIWKIQDCNDLLQKRVNEEYVSEAIRISEDNIMQKIGGQSLKPVGNISSDQILQRIDIKMKTFEQNLGDKVSNLKHSLNTLQETLKNRYTPIDQFFDYQKQQEMQSNTLSIKIKDLEKRFDQIPSKFDIYSQQLLDLNEFTKDLQQEISNIKPPNIDIEELEKYSSLIDKLDPHKICQIESDIKLVNQEQARFKEQLHTLEQELYKKFENINFADSLKQAFIQGGNGLSHQDVRNIVLEMIPKSQIDDDKFKRIARDLNDINLKVENVNQIERRVNKIFRDVDFNNLIKQIKLKQNSEDTMKEFAILNNKYQQLADQYSFIRKDFDLLSMQVRKQGNLSMHITPTHQDNSMSILTTKKLYPVQCLSCGIGNHSTTSKSNCKAHSGQQSRQNNYFTNPTLNQSMDISYNQNQNDSKKQETTQSSAMDITYTTYDESKSFLMPQRPGSNHRYGSKAYNNNMQGNYIGGKKIRPISAKK